MSSKTSKTKQSQVSKKQSASRIEANMQTGISVIPLNQGRYTLVDSEDYERLLEYNWCAVKKDQTWYAYTLTKGCKPLPIHRLITSAPPHLVVDHRNHNGLDNRKKNLRLCTRAENNRNQRPYGKTSRYKGVYWNKHQKNYRARIYHNGKQIHLGYFDDEIEAAKAYDKKARELFGEFAYLNFPDDPGASRDFASLSR